MNTQTIGDLKMKRQPSNYTAQTIKQWDIYTEKQEKWIPARPDGHNCFSWKHRWKLAWDVLTGKADALYWEQA